jgi:hypothetical protein
MSTANEYRQFAEECLRAARSATTEQEKKAFLDMAQLWIQAAAQVAAGGTDLDTDVHPIRSH